MKKVRFTESQIVKILKEFESGIDAQSLCRQHGISRATFYNWRKKYSGMETTQLKRLKELEEENRKLKQMFADISLDNVMLKDLLGKKF
jgi:putative transposase